MIEKIYFTTQEVAQQLNVMPNTILNTRSKIWPASDRDHRYKFTKKEIETMAEYLRLTGLGKRELMAELWHLKMQKPQTTDFYYNKERKYLMRRIKILKSELQNN